MTSLSVAELEHKPFYALFRLHGHLSLHLSFIRPMLYQLERIQTLALECVCQRSIPRIL